MEGDKKNPNPHTTPKTGELSSDFYFKLVWRPWTSQFRSYKNCTVLHAQARKDWQICTHNGVHRTTSLTTWWASVRGKAEECPTAGTALRNRGTVLRNTWWKNLCIEQDKQILFLPLCLRCPPLPDFHKLTWVWNQCTKHAVAQVLAATPQSRCSRKSREKTMFILR